MLMSLLLALSGNSMRNAHMSSAVQNLIASTTPVHAENAAVDSGNSADTSRDRADQLADDFDDGDALALPPLHTVRLPLALAGLLPTPRAARYIVAPDRLLKPPRIA